MKIDERRLAHWLLSGAVLLVLLIYGRPLFVPLVFALLIWAYSLGYLLVNNFVKIAVLRLEAQGPSWHLRSMAQMNAPIHPHNEKTAAPAKR